MSAPGACRVEEVPSELAVESPAGRDPRALPPEPMAPIPEERCPTVLLVDDEEDLRIVTGDILRQEGFAVQEAATGAEGLRLAAQRPDLIVLDVHLPDLDGFEVCRRLKADPVTAAIPVLHLSGVFRELDDRIRGLETGAAAYLTRPLERAELLATIKALLRLGRAEARLQAAESRRRAAEVLADVGRLLTHSLDPAEVGQRMVESVRTLFGAQASALHRLDLESGHLIAVAVSGDAGPAFDRGMVMPRGTGVAGLAVRERRPMVTPDLLADPRIALSPAFKARVERAPYRSVLAVPLLVQDRVIGALGIGDRAGRVFGDEEIRLAQAFADQAALALENARLFAETRDRLEETEALRAVGQALSLNLPTPEALRQVAKTVARVFGADMVGAYFLDAPTDALVPIAGYHVPKDLLPRLLESPFPLARFPLLQEAWATRQPVWTSQYRSDARVDQDFLRAVRPHSLLFAPTLVRGEIVGGLFLVWWTRERTWAPSELRLIEAVASQVGLALERKRGEDALRESEDRFRSAFESAGIGMALQATDGHYLRVNRVLCEMVGYSEAELLRMQYPAIIHPDDRATDLANDRRLLAGEIESYRIEQRYRHKQGHVVWVLANVSMMRPRDGAPGCFVVQVQDVTERKRAEEALADSQRLLRTIIETEPECVKLVAADGTVLDMNRAGLAMIEADSADQVVGQPVEPLVAPEYRPTFRALATAVFRGESGHLEFEMVGLKGTRRWLETHAVPLRTQQGDIMALLAVTRDITERKQAEAALQQSEARLRQAQKMEAVGRLAGGVAHDFNNLLTVISGRSELLLAQMRPGDPARRHVTLIKTTADRATGLTRQLLAFSRKQILQPRVLDLNAVVSEMQEMLRRLIGERVELAIRLGPELGGVTADPGQLEQVILNLAVNARDAMPQGGRLTLETANGELDEAWVRHHPGGTPGSCVMLAVRDTGIGMDAETQARIFEPFFTTKGPDKGTGLGLATVYGIIKQSGGYIALESEPGRGTTFTIYLPRVAAPAEPRNPRPVAVPAVGATGSETILLVEDAEAVREVAREILEMHGYTVLEARHPGEALLTAERHAGPIHLLVTDVVMPQMSGRELAERLAPLRPTMKVLYMSGYVEQAIVHHGVVDPGTVLLQKPFAPEALTRAVREVLASRLTGGVSEGPFRHEPAPLRARLVSEGLTSEPPPSYVAIVRRGAFAVFRALQETLGDAGIAEVTWDRRSAERRSVRHAVEPERRRGERRRPLPGTWTTLGFVLVQRRSKTSGP